MWPGSLPFISTETSKTTVFVQARECLYEKAALVGGEEELVLAQEAAHLSQAYHQVVSEEVLHSLTSSIPGAGGHAAGSGLCPLLVALPGPGAKQGLSKVIGHQVKREHFRALADQHVAQCLLSSAELSSRSLDLLHYLHDCAEVTEAERPEVPTTRSQRKYLGGLL